MKTVLFFLLLLPLSGFCDDGVKVNIRGNSLNDEITIAIGDYDHAVMVQVISDNSTVVWTEHTDEKAFKLDFAFFPKGTYTIQISIYDRVETHSFIKK